MTWMVMGFLLLAAAIVQTAMPSIAWLGGAKPPLLLGLVLYYAMRRDTEHTLVAAATGGFLQDSLSEIPLGCSSLLFALAGGIVRHYRKRLLDDFLLSHLFVGALAAMAVTAGEYLLMRRMGLLCHSLWRGGWKVLGDGALGLAVTPILMVVARLFDRLVGNVEVKVDIQAIQ
jgi:rod shape-determining protein MreD